MFLSDVLGAPRLFVSPCLFFSRRISPGWARPCALSGSVQPPGAWGKERTWKLGGGGGGGWGVQATWGLWAVPGDRAAVAAFTLSPSGSFLFEGFSRASSKEPTVHRCWVAGAGHSFFSFLSPFPVRPGIVPCGRDLPDLPRMAPFRWSGMLLVCRGMVAVFGVH